ncbi:MAG: hypothetical protein A2078_01170 [Nitrospirae bacterium GWC2_57_9]|nr:MAG: hypothetical protein A2078_01170 [Nitrospirae bacterium GWC2_57_9]
MMSYLLLVKLKRRKRTKKMPQSLSVFAVSLQEHPELLKSIMLLLVGKVKLYYFYPRIFRLVRQIPKADTLYHCKMS